MADYGSLVADKAILVLEKQLHSVYMQAAKELTAKLNAFTKRHAAKDKKKKEELEQGLISEDEYKSWLRGQVFMEKQWKDKVDQATKIISHANEEAVKIVNEKKLNVFAENYNHQAYELEKEIGADMGFNLYNTESVARLIKDDPDILPKWKVDQKKDYIWNREKVNNSITQGIIQGESVDDIAKRLITNLCTQNENKMRTFARTSVTGTQNAGRIEQLHDAEDAGIKVKKKWLATLDDRTRDTHRDLDGQEQAVDDPFQSDLGEIMFPGDPHAEPGNVYNCRCTLIYVYEGIDRKSVRRDDEGNMVENMTYKEWKKWKEGEKQENDDNKEVITTKKDENESNPKTEYNKKIEEYDQKLETLRNQRMDAMNADKRDKTQIESLRKQIVDTEAEKENYTGAYNFSDGDIELTERLMSDDVQEKGLAVRKVLDKDIYDLPESKGNGKIVEDSTIKSKGETGWDGTVYINPNYKDELDTFIHEDLHTRSIVALSYGQALYADPTIKRLEEGSVELYKQQICQKNSIPDKKTYKRFTDPLKVVHELTSEGQSLYDYSRELFLTPCAGRMSYIEDKADAAFNSGKLNDNDSERLRLAIHYLKVGK